MLEFALARDSALKEKIRAIHTSPDFGIPPVVVSPFTRPQVKDEIRTLLLNMASDPEARDALASMGADRFVRLEDNAYDGVRVLLEEIPLPVMP